MFIAQLFENKTKRIVVTYPGRFQPFHKGHREVFASLQRKFGSDNVFIITSNNTDGVKSPFNFSDKIRFMHAMGVPDNQVIESSNVYNLPAQFEPIKDQIVFITAVGQPDEKRLQPGRVKKDGSPGFFQPVPNDSKDFKTADEHGYVIIAPEYPQSISIGGKNYDASHGTQTRELWNQVRDNPEQRKEFLQQLYGRTDPELGHILDKIPHGTPEPVEPPAAKMKNAKKDLVKVSTDKTKKSKTPKKDTVPADDAPLAEDEFDESSYKNLQLNYKKNRFRSLKKFDPFAESDVEESMYQYDKDDPYNSEFAPDVGMGRMTLRSWKLSMIRRVKEFAAELERNGQDLDRAALWDHIHKKLKSMNLDPIAQEIELAHQELENIRRRGGVRSRAFKK